MSLQKDSECLPGTRYSRCSNKDAVQPSTGKVGGSKETKPHQNFYSNSGDVSGTKPLE
jgi:hypothetical protein